MRKHLKLGEPKLDLTVDIALHEFWQWALEGNSDVDAERLFAEWMVGRLLGLPKVLARRVERDNEYLHLPNGVVIDLDFSPGDDSESYRRHFAFCIPKNSHARWRKAWQPEEWEFHLFSMNELVSADVLEPAALAAFLDSRESMAPKEFRLVARAQLGLST